MGGPGGTPAGGPGGAPVEVPVGTSTGDPGGRPIGVVGGVLRDGTTVAVGCGKVRGPLTPGGRTGW